MSTEKMNYLQFYKKHGIRYVNSLATPVMSDYNTLALPKESIIHWVDYEGNYEVGPREDEPLLARSSKLMYAEAISHYYKPEHMKPGFILVKDNTASFVLKYDSSNPNIRRMSKMVSEYVSRDVLPLYVYGLLHKTYKYKKYIDSELNRWLNYHRTVFQTALDVSRLSNRQQYLEFDSPKKFPSFQNIRRGESGIDRSNIRLLSTHDHWLIVSLWNLIANNGNDFIFNNYKREDFNRINIIWRVQDKYALINLGVLLGFAYGDNAVVHPAKLQRLLITMFIKLNSQRYLKDSSADELAEDITEVGDEKTLPTTDDTLDPEMDDLNDEGNITVTNDILMANPFNKPIDTAPERQSTTAFKNVSNVVLDDDDGMELNDSADEDAFIRELDTIADVSDTEEITSYNAYVPSAITAESVIDTEGSKLVKAGIMSIGSFERLKGLAVSSMALPDPLDNYSNIAEATAIRPEDIIIDKHSPLPVTSNDIIDPGMTSSSLVKYHEHYIENIYSKDVLSAVMSIQRGGLVIKSYDIESVENINDKYQVHKVQIETLKGHVSTLTFKLPIIESDGTFKVAGTKCFFRKQRGDVPIRKVDYHSVALTSYYSKMFINRTSRKQFSYEGFLQNHIVNSSMDNLNGIRDVKFDNVFDGTVSTPRVYSILSRTYSSFKVGEDTLHFSIKEIDTLFPDRLRRKDIIPIGVNNKTKKTSLYLTNTMHPIVLDDNGAPTGMTMESLLGVNPQDIPADYAEVSLFGKSIPLVLFLAHHLGFGNLLKTLKVTPRREARGKRITLESGEYSIRFNDEVLIFNRNINPQANLIVNGLLRFKNSINTISVYDLDKKSIYSDLFEEIKAPLKLLKESRDMYNLWVDPITEKILQQMNEPTDLVMLFIRAVELLLTDEHPESIDIGYMRDKGYERITGMLYGELVKAIRDYNTKSLYSNNKLTINPQAVWYSVISDQAAALVEDSNPIHSMKEKEAIVYSGAGGRSGKTMTAASRKFHKSNIGVTSEATVDSGDAGTTIFNVADPNYTNVYGISDRVVDLKNLPASKILSPSALLAPGGTHDDPKRLNFTNVQNSQTTFSTGSTPMPMRTGMEKVVHTRSSNTFATTAPQNGKVIDATPTSLLVEYADGTKVGFTIGRIFGKAGGNIIPHHLVANVKKGSTFKSGDCLYYNSHYFTTDLTDNNAVTYKCQALARTALVENYDVFEDSAAMSKSFSTKLTSGLTYVRNIRLDSSQTIKGLIKVGDSVQGDSILCTLHSSQLDDSLFSEQALTSLQTIAALNPKAKYAGTVEKIDVIYTCDLENLSEEVADLIRHSDAKLYRESKKTNSGVKNGRVDVGFRVDGVNMTSDEIIIQIYITESIGMSVADKIVVGNQLKATVGRYWSDSQTSEDGEEIDLLFSAISVDNRIVLDAELIGTTNTLLVELTKRFIESYDK